MRALLMLFVACQSAPYQWHLPAGMAEPWVPADNPMSDAKVELGRHLFYDQRLSANGDRSCASCHEQRLAFTDGKKQPTGTTGQAIPRNAMTLSNVAFYYPYTWENSLLHTLEEQALVPMFAEAPIELGLTAVIGEVLARMRSDATYRALFASAFPNQRDAFTTANIVSSIAAFERTLISGSSPYDRYAYGKDEDAISADAKAGMELFFSERCECYHCHSGINFTSAFRSAETKTLTQDYQNNGLYNLDEHGAYPAESPGLIAITHDLRDTAKFRVPTLRNIALTAPYMHDGSIATLPEVIDHYAAGGRGDGRSNPRKSPFVRGFAMTVEEKAALLAFLNALTDEAFITDERFSDPWSRQRIP